MDPCRDCVAECDVAGVGVRTVAAAGRDGGDDGDVVAGRDDVAAPDVADGGGVAVVGDGDGGEEWVADKSCNAKRCPSWVRRCLRAPTYLLGNDENNKKIAFKHRRLMACHQFKIQYYL